MKSKPTPDAQCVFCERGPLYINRVEPDFIKRRKRSGYFFCLNRKCSGRLRVFRCFGAAVNDELRGETIQIAKEMS